MWLNCFATTNVTCMHTCIQYIEAEWSIWNIVTLYIAHMYTCIWVKSLSIFSDAFSSSHGCYTSRSFVCNWVIIFSRCWTCVHGALSYFQWIKVSNQLAQQWQSILLLCTLTMAFRTCPSAPLNSWSITANLQRPLGWSCPYNKTISSMVRKENCTPFPNFWQQ